MIEKEEIIYLTISNMILSNKTELYYGIILGVLSFLIIIIVIVIISKLKGVKRE